MGSETSYTWDTDDIDYLDAISWHLGAVERTSRPEIRPTTEKEELLQLIIRSVIYG